MYFFGETVDIVQPYRIALDDRDDTIFAVVSPEDYNWLLQWRWGWVWDKRGKKRYATRPTRIQGKPVRIYMHKAILSRSGQVPPDLFHTMGDHQDGDSLNNQRPNLRWATAKMNRANIRCVSRDSLLASLP